jgi:hypothetical protein
MRLVLIDWLDSYGCSPRWEGLKDGGPPLLHCRSVGWLTRDGKDAKTIVPHLSDPAYKTNSPQGCGDITIPAGSIVRMYTLADPRKRRATSNSK